MTRTAAIPDRPGAAEWVPSRPTMAKLRSVAQGCRGCELYKDATQAVVGDGPRSATIMVVGEQPGDAEDRAGLPFVGPAGKLLDKALDAAGIDPGSVFRTNVVKHFRFSGTQGKRRIHATPDRVHVEACAPWLMAELAVARPSGVVVLGATAGKAIFGPGFRVGDQRGRLTDWPNTGPFAGKAEPDWVLPTTHPSAVLRSRQRDEAMAAFIADLKVAAAAAQRAPAS